MFVPRSLDELKGIVEQQLEETVWLEFKRELPNTNKNDDIARPLASMANAEGGVVVYGIDQDREGRARRLVPIPLAGTAERITQVAQQLDDSLNLTSVFAIPSENDQRVGFLVVEVPQSDRAPHFHKGTAWGRSSKGRIPLTRRRIGELYARQPGFAEEFGLALSKPGRVICRQIAEPNLQHSLSSGVSRPYNYFLVFENDGDGDAFDVHWEWVEDAGSRLPEVLQDRFPLEQMQRGLKVRVDVF